MLTKRQKQVLDFIGTHAERKGYAPSLDEIRARFRFASVSTAHYHVTKLRDSGYIAKTERKPRSITPIGAETMVQFPFVGQDASTHPLSLDRGPDASTRGAVFTDISAEKTTSVAPPVHHMRQERQTLPLDAILCGDAVDVLKTFPPNSVDIVMTSPPYDGIREYKGFTYDLHAAGAEMYRVLKDGGVVVMVIQDQTRNFGKSLTSFRTILDWCDTIGFKLFETLIYRKYGAEGAWWNKRFRVDHEYMPVFLKGERPQYFNKEYLKIPSKHGGKTLTGGGTRLTNGVRIATRPITINPMKCRGTIWEYLTAGDGSRLKHQHPATFPDKLPYDFIRCFCPKDGIVLDPYVGSGTTTVAAKNLGRRYIGIDIAPEYCEIAKKRMREECARSSQQQLL